MVKLEWIQSVIKYLWYQWWDNSFNFFSLICLWLNCLYTIEFWKNFLIHNHRVMNSSKNWYYWLHMLIITVCIGQQSACKMPSGMVYQKGRPKLRNHDLLGKSKITFEQPTHISEEILYELWWRYTYSKL